MSSPGWQKENTDQQDELPKSLILDEVATGRENGAQATASKGGDTDVKHNEGRISDETGDSSTPKGNDSIPVIMAQKSKNEDAVPDTKGKSTDQPENASETQSSPDPMESSTATLKPSAQPTKEDETSVTERTSGHLSVNEHVYRDTTPKTPAASQPPSRSASTSNAIPKYPGKLDAPDRAMSPTRSDAGFDEKASASEDEREHSSKSEIQSIMEQFSEDGQGPGHEEVMSPRLEAAGPLLGSPIQHPPRKSSLEPLNSSANQSMKDLRITSPIMTTEQTPWDSTDVGPAVPPKPGSIRSFVAQRTGDSQNHAPDTPISPPLHRPPPPEPEPEPPLPFDFHRFLEQLRHRTADPVAKFLRSFLQEFGKKQWMVHEQVKIISDFLVFITGKMAQCEVWREVSDAEFDNAREGMEKLVMNRLYTQTFSPCIPSRQPVPKNKRINGERFAGPGRRGQHEEDVERDEILGQKIAIYGWIKEEHLDITPVAESGAKFLMLAQKGMF
jgi:hypothetical protein